MLKFEDFLTNVSIDDVIAVLKGEYKKPYFFKEGCYKAQIPLETPYGYVPFPLEIDFDSHTAVACYNNIRICVINDAYQIENDVDTFLTRNIARILFLILDQDNSYSILSTLPSEFIKCPHPLTLLSDFYGVSREATHDLLVKEFHDEVKKIFSLEEVDFINIPILSTTLYSKRDLGDLFYEEQGPRCAEDWGMENMPCPYFNDRRILQKLPSIYREVTDEECPEIHSTEMLRKNLVYFEACIFGESPLYDALRNVCSDFVMENLKDAPISKIRSILYSIDDIRREAESSYTWSRAEMSTKQKRLTFLKTEQNKISELLKAAEAEEQTGTQSTEARVNLILQELGHPDLTYADLQNYLPSTELDDSGLCRAVATAIKYMG